MRIFIRISIPSFDEDHKNRCLRLIAPMFPSLRFKDSLLNGWCEPEAMSIVAEGKVDIQAEELLRLIESPLIVKVAVAPQTEHFPKTLIIEFKP